MFHSFAKLRDGADLRRRSVLAVAAIVALTLAGAGNSVLAQSDPYVEPENPGLPPSNMEIDLSRVALVVTDPQIDFLSPDGVTWGLVGNNVTQLGTVENIEKLFVAAKAAGIPVLISPHHYFPTDHGWKFEGALEKVMHAIGMFDRVSPYSLEGFENSGADFMPQYKQYIYDGKTIIASPHKIYGPEQNDLALQLRKRGVDQVILAGMSANLCVQAHMHELLEMGFEVAVVKDATAAAQIPEGDGYLAALINFRFMANAVWTADEVVALLSKAAGE